MRRAARRTEEEHVLRVDGGACGGHQAVHPEAEVAVRLESQHQLHEAARRARAQRERGELAARHQTLARRHHSARARNLCAGLRRHTNAESTPREERKSPVERQK